MFLVTFDQSIFRIIEIAIKSEKETRSKRSSHTALTISSDNDDALSRRKGEVDLKVLVHIVPHAFAKHR